MISAYSQFHVKQALHGIREFALSLKGSMEMILLAAGQVILMALAFLAWPLWMGALWLSEHWPMSYVVALVLAHSGTMALPIFLLRKRLLPKDSFVWGLALPITPRMRWLAHFCVARLFVLPLSVGYLISSIACWMQLPATHAVWASALTLLLISLLLVLVFGTLILTWRYKSLVRHSRSSVLLEAPVVHHDPYQQLPLKPRLLQQWYRLFFLPFWRMENGIGKQQTVLFISAMTLFSMWCIITTPFMRFLLCISAISFTLVVTDQGVKALQEHWQTMRPVLRSLPFKLFQLHALNGFLSLLPACVVLLWLSLLLSTQAEKIHVGVALWFLAMSLLAHIILVSFVRLSSAGRARIVFFSIVLLSAFGSELWK
jgi:hypothetical protein